MPLLGSRSDARVKLRRGDGRWVIPGFDFAPNCVHVLLDPTTRCFVALLFCKAFVIGRHSHLHPSMNAVKQRDILKVKEVLECS